MEGGGKRAAATVGVLALQGSFNEHIAALRRVGVRGVEVRKAEQLPGLGALIIPGGESTTMAKLARYHNLFPALREFVNSGKPVWGTCAGLIFLADRAVGQKTGGQELIGGLDCTVHRNFFGSQLQSFETDLSVPELAAKEGGPPSFRGVFIRAPAILEVGPSVEVLADYSFEADKTMNTKASIEGQMITNSMDICDTQSTMKVGTDATKKVIVAARQGSLLVTAFHPELTSDTRWHSFFLKMPCEVGEQSLKSISKETETLDDCQVTKPIYLPIIE